MNLQLKSRDWTPPRISAGEKRRLALQVEERGANAVAREMRPWDLRMLLVGGAVFLLGVALLATNVHKYAMLLGALLAFWGLMQVPITIFREVRGYTRRVDWLSSIQRYYGKDAAKYGN